MLPPVDEATGNLPPGVHLATWKEFVIAFGFNPSRQRLLDGLRLALGDLRAAGCRRAYIGGSFVTTKAEPADFDACWEEEGVDPDRLEPVLLLFGRGRRRQKAHYSGELFPANSRAEGHGTRFLEFFQVDPATGARRGVVAFDLENLL